MERFWSLISREASRRPFAWLTAVLAISIPAFLQVRHLGLDTNLKRLLPKHSASVRWDRELEKSVGDGGYFSILVEGRDPEVLRRAIETIASEVSSLPGVQSVEYRRPIDFINRYRYMLVPEQLLRDFQDVLDDWEIEVNPFLVDLEPEGELEGSPDDDPNRLDRLLRHYANMGEYHSDPDGRVMGMIVRTREGISNLASLRVLYGRLSSIAREVAGKAGIWWGISGNLRSRVDEFDLIISDLRRAGAVSLAGILLALTLAFRSIRILPVLVLPLLAGLLWSFALIPSLVGDLNSITAFLLLVLFGMGIDYSIHLVSRFQKELQDGDPERALRATLRSTGRSVLTSGATTALALSILAISDFRGFADFGVVGGTSTVIIVLAMLLVLPPVVMAGHRLGLVAPDRADAWRFRVPVPGRALTVVTGGLVALAAVLAASGLEFDYDFTNLKAKVEGMEAVRERHEKVYPATSAPAALYVARHLAALDRMLEILERTRDATVRPHIGSFNSIRNFAPDERHYEQRLQILAEIKESLHGRWVRRIDDPDKQKVIDDILVFKPPAAPPRIADVPASIKRRLMARDGSGELILGVDTNGHSRDGRMAMAFTADLYDLQLPEGIRGPTGDKPVLAEILWLVTSESPWIIGLTLLGITVLVWIDRRSLAQTVWVLTPLVAGMVLTLGALVAAGGKLNFFNMVVLPAILGVGVDHGVHYYRRWHELGQDTRDTQEELFLPISVCSLTTIMGYLGMVLAHHPGLRSIGILAVVGLTATWFTALVLLPGLLLWRRRQAAKPGSEPAERPAVSAS
ncbi:MAG: RND family transporter [Acidobacteriota bacterium]